MKDRDVLVAMMVVMFIGFLLMGGSILFGILRGPPERASLDALVKRVELLEQRSVAAEQCVVGLSKGLNTSFHAIRVNSLGDTAQTEILRILLGDDFDATASNVVARMVGQ